MFRKCDTHKASAMEREATGEIILYQPDETLAIQVKLDAAHDTVWLSTSQMSLLFAKEESTIRRHIINIFAEEELIKDINVHFLHVNGTNKPVTQKRATEKYSAALVI